MIWSIIAFVLGAFIGSVFPAFRWKPEVLAKVFKKEEAGNPWDSRFW